MNVKKTIAGVMAGAMAVSAMAATVSADQDSIVLSYDLKTYVPNYSDGKVTFSLVYSGEQYNDVSFTPTYTTYSWEHQTTDGNNGIDPLSFTVSNSYISDGVYEATVTLSSKVVKWNSDAGKYEQESEVTETRKYTKDSDKANAAPTEWTLIDDDGYTAKNSLGEKIQVFNGMRLNVPITDGRYVDGTNRILINRFDAANLGYSTAYSSSSDYKTGYVFDRVQVSITYKISAEVLTSATSGWYLWDSDIGSYGFTDDQLIAMGIDPYSSSTPTVQIVNAAGVGYTDNLDKDATYATAISLTAGSVDERIYPMKTVLSPSGSATTLEVKEPLGTQYAYKYTDTDGDGVMDAVVDYRYNTYTIPADNDVVGALTSRKADGNYYTKPIAVLNDAIANNENVVFTFYSYDGYVATTKSNLTNQWVTPDVAYGYQTSAYDWYNPSFGQQLYTNLDDSYSLYGTTAYDLYGSYSSAWGTNLFTGAIVVNNGLTMQLSDTDKFSWGSNTLSFDWFTITDEGKITEAKTFLTSMLLYTPVDWYWDRLDVTVGNLESDDVDFGAGIEDEGEVIEDEDIDEIVVDVEEEPVIVETEPVTEVVTEPVTEAAPVETEAPAPVAPAPSPSTGNAPVALAVIPVALAAAAVIAKKRG